MSTPNSQGLPTALTVISANIEGLTAVKASMLLVMCKDQHCQCLCLQETHRSRTQARPKIPEMSLVAERPHNKYGSAVFIRDDLKVKGISICEEDDIELITIELCNAIIQSVYKPPNKQFLLQPLHHVVIRDFNSHNTLWGYSTTGTDGEAVEQWAKSSNLSLIHDAKLQKSFTSARWKKGYNPDLIFASTSIENMFGKSILNPIPHTQHRPLCVTVKPIIVPQPTPFRRRFNLRKADWLEYSTQVDQNIDEVDDTPECYENFVGIICMASRKHIPRECRTNYIPGLTDKSKTLYEAYPAQYRCNPLGDAGNNLIELMAEQKKERLEEMITSIDLTHNSRKAWKTINSISNDPTPPCLVNANQVAHQLIVYGRGNMPTKSKWPILTTVEQRE